MPITIVLDDRLVQEIRSLPQPQRGAMTATPEQNIARTLCRLIDEAVPDEPVLVKAVMESAHALLQILDNRYPLSRRYHVYEQYRTDLCDALAAYRHEVCE